MNSRLLISFIALLLQSCVDSTRPPNPVLISQLERAEGHGKDNPDQASYPKSRDWSFFSSGGSYPDPEGAGNRPAALRSNSIIIPAAANQKIASKTASTSVNGRANGDKLLVDQQGLSELWRKRNEEMQANAGSGTIYTHQAQTAPKLSVTLPPSSGVKNSSTQAAVTQQPKFLANNTNLPERTCAYSSNGYYCKNGANSGSRYCWKHGELCIHPGCSRYAVEGSTSCHWH